MASAEVGRDEVQELWLREILRVSREVQRCEKLLAKLDASCPFDWSSAAFQSRLVERVLRDPHQRAFPPNRFEAAFFWRDLIARLRAKIAATSDGTTKLHAELEAKEKDALKVAGDTEEEDMRAGWYRSYELADICDDTTTTTLDGPTGSVVVCPSCPPERARCYPFRVETGCMAESIGLVMWPAGFTMCEFALDHPDLFRGKRVLELGAGIGLTSVVVAKFTRPAAIVATDFDERALENIHRNFKNNGLVPSDDTFTRPSSSSTPLTYTSSAVTHLSDLTAASAASAAAPSECSVHTACVDWYNFSADQIAAFQADVIIACDTTYVEAILVPFAQTVHATLKANPRATVYLAQAERHPSTFLMYLDALREEGLTLKELPTDRLHQRFNFDRTTCPVALHRVTL